MDSQLLINLSLSATMSVIGWFAHQLWTAVAELKSDLAKLREELPKEYVIKDDYKQDIRDIKEMLNKLFDRLDSKADK
jgi:hypothetical protein